jgi:tRNA modification GTPase
VSTIVALSTPRGRGAIGVIRLSGPAALSITRSLTSNEKEFEPRKATLVHVRSGPEAEVLDEVIVTFFESPNSLTGENVVEIACHGSPAVIRQIIDMTLDLGAHLAGPGEFTLRAVMNGKIDLAEAEAIRDLIDSQTHAAAKQAARQLNGELSSTLQPLKDLLLEVIVLMESALEFVEDDLPETSRTLVQDRLQRLADDLQKLTASYSAGHLLHDGVKVAITGRPNVGKSSLFNRLVARDRAIVTDVPGTTRDTLTESVDIGGIPMVLTDTAGLRSTVDDVETLGIARAQQAMSDADLILLVLDGSVPIDSEDRDLISQTSGVRRLVVVNKCDVVVGFSNADLDGASDGIKISAKTGEGIEQLRAMMLAEFNAPGLDSGGLLITNARHHDLLNRAHQEVLKAIELAKEQRSEEVVLVPLHNSLRYLGAITGETTTEDILSKIFSTFCIGK